MRTDRAWREGVTLFLGKGWHNVAGSLAVLAICAIGTAVAVLLQHGLMGGLPRLRADRAFAAFATECQGMMGALGEGRLREAWKRFRRVLSKWFSWHNSVPPGRFGTALIGALAVLVAVLTVVELIRLFAGK